MRTARSRGVLAAVALGVVCLLAAGCDGGGGDDGCAIAETWPAEWASAEERVVESINEQRGRVTNCGSEGTFAEAPPFDVDPALTCAARLHARDMAEQGYTGHQSLDGREPSDRMEDAGYLGWTASGENIAWGYPTPEDVLVGWLASDGHCANIMAPAFEEIGAGFYEGGPEGTYWVLNFGTQ